ncbi:hypothetical protein [Mucilaginibacter sp.]|uniref:hypothetical protein n=1 Tax=Mucilaginibacter sp. TaxID=1882438 RepID=UPI0026108E20|nr:hypothetical protein [Mucilaginibacter sp.]MDB4926322.1 hypothetical protein [Mucilaginibacter sp.]
MKQNITLTIDDETKSLLKEEAKRRGVSIKQVGEEYFQLMVTLLQAKKQNTTRTI